MSCHGGNSGPGRAVLEQMKIVDMECGLNINTNVVISITFPECSNWTIVTQKNILYLENILLLRVVKVPTVCYLLSNGSEKHNTKNWSIWMKGI